MIYDLIYDEDGNVVDAWIMQSGHGSGKSYVKTKIPTSFKIGNSISFGSANHYLYHNNKQNEIFEGGVIEGSLNVNKLSQVSVWKDFETNIRDEYSVLRFIQYDENGNIILHYDGEKYSDINHNNEIIDFSNKTKARLKYSKLYIEKTVDLHADDIVETNDELTYKIIIKNNSGKNYTDDIIVTENISDYVTYKDYEVSKNNISFNEDLNNKKIEWNIGKLNSGEEIVIQYTVVVKNNNYGEIIESTGTVADIPSSIVKNKIGGNLIEDESSIINQIYKELKNQYNGKELINEIYKQSMGINLNFDNFNITNLIKNTKLSSTSSTTIYLNENNNFYNQVLNKYWSSLSVTSHNYEEHNIMGYDLKAWRGYELENRRADTIYSENFKTGDILIYQNENDVIYNYSNNTFTTTPITYENGEYAYIYIEGEGFVGVNLGNDGISGTDDDRNEFTQQYYKDRGLSVSSNTNETNKDVLEFYNYQTLFGKDYYVILRPSLAMPESIQLNVPTLELCVGDTYKLETTIYPETSTLGTDLTWTSNDKNVAVVDENGIVKAVGAGSCIITVKSQNGKMATCEIIVNYKTEQLAIKELADAYYNREINGQYCSVRRSYIDAPEEGTVQNTIYSVCSNFTFTTYYQAFGIKIPSMTNRLITYAHTYYDPSNITTNDVVEYWMRTKDENDNNIYVDNQGNVKNINLSSNVGRKAYVEKLLNDCKLQVGDVICYRTPKEGHALLVYEIIYDENANPVDAKIRESTSSYEKLSTKITYKRIKLC